MKYFVVTVLGLYKALEVRIRIRDLALGLEEFYFYKIDILHSRLKLLGDNMKYQFFKVETSAKIITHQQGW